MSLETDGNKGVEEAKEGGKDDQFIQSIMNSLRGKSGSDSGGHSDSNNGNTSDNSALASIGNSVGFNFDNEEGMSSKGQNDSNDDSDGASQRQQKTSSTSVSVAVAPVLTKEGKEAAALQASALQSEAAANAAVSNLRSIVSSFSSSYPSSSNCSQLQQRRNADIAERKRRASATATVDDKSGDDDSGGYNSDDDADEFDDNVNSGKEGNGKKGARKSRGGKKKRGDDNKREERNQREKERSLRIAKQIGELRNLLSSGGVVVPKGTKSSVLTEAANYIRMLQQHQYRSEIDRHQLVQQMQLIGSGAHGPQAATVVRHAAAQNGVWSLGNFGGVPPKSAMTFYDPVPNNAESNPSALKPQTIPSSSAPSITPFNQTKEVDPTEYRFVFNSCGAGMAIASMGGAFIDCNQLFCQLSNFSKQEVCALTIFNLTARQDLQIAFDQISQLISPPMDESGNPRRERPKPVVFRGAMKNRDDLGLSVSLVKGDDGVSKCFCVTIVKHRESPFDTTKPLPVSFESIVPCSTISKEIKAINTSPAFTSG